MLEQLRNNAIHSSVIPEPEGKVTAWHRLGHVRAKKLAGKDLLKQFRWFYDAVIVLRDDAEDLTDVTRSPELPLPQRPPLPNRGEKKVS